MEYEPIKNLVGYNSIELFKKELKIEDKEIEINGFDLYLRFADIKTTKEDEEFVPYSKKSGTRDDWDPRDEGPSGGMPMLKQFYTVLKNGG